MHLAFVYLLSFLLTAVSLAMEAETPPEEPLQLPSPRQLLENHHLEDSFRQSYEPFGQLSCKKVNMLDTKVFPKDLFENCILTSLMKRDLIALQRTCMYFKTLITPSLIFESYLRAQDL